MEYSMICVLRKAHIIMLHGAYVLEKPLDAPSHISEASLKLPLKQSSARLLYYKAPPPPQL